MSDAAKNGHRILLAEDEEHIAKLVSFKLAREGYELTWAKNGKEAVDLLLAQPWSLMILDVMMPICDGWEVLKQVRATHQTSALPVLMLTAKGVREDIFNAVELGATRYLKKPFDPSNLAAVVKELIK